jgi:hypothetical protein
VTVLNANDAKVMGRPLEQILEGHAPIDFVLRSHSSANSRVCYEVVDRPSKAVDNLDAYARDFAAFARATGRRHDVDDLSPARHRPGEPSDRGVLPRSDCRRWLRDVLEEAVTPRIIRSCPTSSQETKGKAASQHCDPDRASGEEVVHLRRVGEEHLAVGDLVVDEAEGVAIFGVEARSQGSRRGHNARKHRLRERRCYPGRPSA